MARAYVLRGKVSAAVGIHGDLADNAPHEFIILLLGWSELLAYQLLHHAIPKRPLGEGFSVICLELRTRMAAASNGLQQRASP